MSRARAVPRLEVILTSPEYFGLVEATPVQRARCRAIEGLPLGDLTNDVNVVEMFGGELPSARPAEVVDISAIRVAKTLGGAAHAVWASQSVDASGAKHGDIIKYFVAALKLDGTRPFFSHLLAAIERSPAIASLVVGEPTVTSVKLRHPTGHIIEITPIPIDRAGASALSVFAAGAFVDEGPRLVGEEDGVKNYDHTRNGVLGRLLPGAQFLTVGSPWQPYGPIYDLFVERFGKPGPDLVVMRTRGRVANPSWWSSERCAELEARNPITFTTDERAEFAEGEHAVMPSDGVEAAVSAGRGVPSELRPATITCGGRAECTYEPCDPITCADPSQMRHDSWVAMVIGWMLPVIEADADCLWVECDDPRARNPVGPRGAQIMFRPEFNRHMAMPRDERGDPMKNPAYKPPKPILRVYEVLSWSPRDFRGARPGAEELVRQVAALSRKYGTDRCYSDQGEQYGLEAIFRGYGMRFTSYAWAAPAVRTVCVDRLRSLVVERRLVLPNHDRLRNDMLRVRARATGGAGQNFQYIVRGSSDHMDHLSALLLGMRVELEGNLSGSPMHISRRRFEIPG